MACNDKNPLIREGVDRLNRVLASLSPGSAPVDDRSMEDLMLFAKRYAAFLNYKNPENNNEGHWEDLMKVDISYVLAVLLSFDVFKISDYIKLLYKKTKLAISANDETESRREFKYLFDLIFSIAYTIDEQCSYLKDEPDYQLVIRSLIKTKLNSPFSKLYNSKKDNQDLFLLSNKTDPSAPITTINSKGTIHWANFELTDEKLKITIPGTVTVEKISHLINHNVFNNQINLLLSGISTILAKSEQLLQKSLSEYSKHEPHYALFLAFLKLFKNAQDSINQYTKSHLDFYYKDVLRLKNQSPAPDKAHLVIGLQKHIQQHLLAQGTLFKGGKDVLGKERHYALTENVVFNQAAVSDIKAFQIHGKNLLSFSKANSFDGNGEEFEGDDKSWYAFGKKQNTPTSEAGFAIASNLLFLKEGRRTIDILVQFADAPKTKFKFITTRFSGRTSIIPFEVGLTGEEEWVNQKVNGVYDGEKGTLNLRIILDVEEQPILPYSENIHESNFNTTLPLLTARMVQTESRVAYSELMNSKVSSIKLAVDVKGVKDLALNSDGGSIDSSKPFKPWGDFPKKGASFYIGSREIFQKNLDSLILNFPVGVTFTSSYLHKNKWNVYTVEDIKNGRYRIKPNTGSTLLEPASLDFSQNQILQASSFEGYLRLQLVPNDYSMKEFMIKVSTYVNQMVERAKITEPTDPEQKPGTSTRTSSISSAIKSANPITDQILFEFEKAGFKGEYIEMIPTLSQILVNTNIPIPVAEEVIAENFSIDYRASQNITSVDIDPNRHFFYHLNPFGYAHQTISDELSLIPQFSRQGELLIGIEKAEAPLTVQLLFLLVEGSSNPLKNQEPVLWHFLDKNNKWIEFEKSRIIDGTINLTSSGIVSVNFPKEASFEHTALESGLLWIRASVAQNTDAVCKIIDIKTQGALVELVQEGEVEYRNILSSGSIAKLKNSDSAIKKIEQPLDSFHGKVKEIDSDYYQRVSERLRHKQRAKSIWDYEHLVLQQFPEIHKVKCLNHSGFYQEVGTKVFCENFPGNVTVICIPDQKNKSYLNPLRPYTPIGLLTDIFIYLSRINNPFVKLHVVNPRFEEIQADFEVRFHDFMDEVFYRNLLDMEIEQFLCPWAFDSNSKITFGGSIHQSTLINFIEERPYVDFMSCIKLHHIIRDDNGNVYQKKSDLEEVNATSGRSILVSHFDENQPEPRHKIKVIQICDC
ncbi:hypothetical protein [Aquiflexum sp.]|uniref:hypothetical protein n=1 Tax=Aquiflexum sp. TaxID=1872584 RepID=UPI0035935C1E